MNPQTDNPQNQPQPSTTGPQTIVVQPTVAPVAGQPTAPFSPSQATDALVTSYQAPDSLSANAVASNKRSALKPALVALVIAVMFIGGYFASSGVAAMSQSNARKQAAAFISALNSGNNNGAYKMTSSNLRGQQTESQFADNMGDLKASTPTLSNQSVGFNGSNATYTATEDGLPATADGTTGTFTVALVKSGPVGWKVDSVNVD